MSDDATEKRRVLLELVGSAPELSQHGWLSRTVLISRKGLCEMAPQYTASNVVAIRTGRAKRSQSVFASLLNVSVSTVQKWRSGSSGKRPSGAAAKLLHLLETKGIEALI